MALHLIDEYVRPSDGVLADVGCGTGQLSVELVRRGFSVTALDYSEQMLRMAESNLSEISGSVESVSFVCADMNNYVFPVDRYSTVCALGCIEFLDNVPGVIANLGSAICQGGYFMLSMPNVLSPFVWPEKLARRLLHLRSFEKRPSSHHPLSLDAVKLILREKSMELIDVRFSVPATLVGTVSVPPAFMMRRLAQIDSYPFAPWLANTWVALFRKGKD